MDRNTKIEKKYNTIKNKNEKWNIRNMKDKENEMLHEFNNAKLEKLALTETKKKVHKK